MISIAIGFQQGLDHLPKHSSFTGVLRGRGVERFELVARAALAFRDHSQESTTPKVRAGSDRQQAERTENKSDNAPIGFVVPLAACCDRCEEGASGSSYKPKEQEQSHFASGPTPPF